MSVSFNGLLKEYQLKLHCHMSHLVSLGLDARGNILRIDNALGQMGKRLHTVEMRLEDICRQQAAAQEELGKPFPQEEELRTKSDRLLELDMELNMERSQPENPEVTGEVSEKKTPKIREER